jgi:hypothetical protein
MYEINFQSWAIFQYRPVVLVSGWVASGLFGKALLFYSLKKKKKSYLVFKDGPFNMFAW